jgi:hypothetical protein
VLRRLLTIALLGAALTAPLPAQAGTEPDPHYEEPVVGECHDYGWKVYLAPHDTSAAVPCKRDHTAKVFKVFQLPSDLDWTATDAQIGALIKARCHTAWKKWLGRDQVTIARTAYGEAWYSPTQAQRDAGARWIRCDIVLFASRGLARLPKNKAPMIPQPMITRVQKCLVGKNYLATACNYPHEWKATGSFKLAKGKYPSATKFRTIASQRCPRLVNSRRYLYWYPSKSLWAGGYRIMICYTKTKH